MEDTLIQNIKELYNAGCDDEHGRERSWEYCYNVFCDARDRQKDKELTDADYDLLSLHLAFYLASWGMLRNSFLLKKAYTVHNQVVRTILENDYSDLVDFGNNCTNGDFDKIWKRMNALSSRIRNCYKVAVSQVQVTDTLVTKILMGTLGCVPAYDRYFSRGMKEYFKNIRGIGNYREDSLRKLIEFYSDKKAELEAERQKMKTHVAFQSQKLRCERYYPQMKLLDMAFWKLGYDSEAKAAEKQVLD